MPYSVISHRFRITFWVETKACWPMNVCARLIHTRKNQKKKIKTNISNRLNTWTWFKLCVFVCMRRSCAVHWTEITQADILLVIFTQPQIHAQIRQWTIIRSVWVICIFCFYYFHLFWHAFHKRCYLIAFVYINRAFIWLKSNETECTRENEWDWAHWKI